MALSVVVREGTTDYHLLQLLSDRQGINLSAVDHVVMVMRDDDGTVVSFSTDDATPQLYINDPATGIMEFRPKATDMVASKGPYYGYFWVFPTSARQYAVPDGAEFRFEMRPKYD